MVEVRHRDDSRAAGVLTRLFQAAVNAALPDEGFADFLPEPPRGRTVVIGAGKAAASMAQVLDNAWNGPLSGLVVTRHGHGADCGRIDVIEASHPVLDEDSLRAADAVVARLQGLTEDDLVICLLSGGGSALLSRPAPGITLAEKQSVTRQLLLSGAPIADINCVRKHLSAIKGGRLALLAAPARLVTLAISDVPGDDASVLASGPTVPDPTTRQQAAAIIARDLVDPPASVMAWLNQDVSETPKPSATVPDVRIVASPDRSLHAAAEAARREGYAPWILTDYAEGAARDVAKQHGEAVRRVLEGGAPVNPPCVILSGGETTVTVNGKGRGGRNAEFLLALAIELDGAPDIWALAADTDGIDGSEDNAGAIIGPATLACADRNGVSASAHLAANDAYSFFDAVDGLVFTGPTRTNVNDLRAILIDRPPTAA